MTHEEVKNREVAESYVRGRLGESERAAFEDHYFACDECFEQVEMLQKFAGGVRDAARSGRLPTIREAASGGWFRPAFYIACAASLLAVVPAGWMVAVELPHLQSELARARLEMEAGRQRVAALEKDLAGTAPAAARVGEPQPNLPLLMLEASRSREADTVLLPAGATQLAVWVEPPPSAAGTLYRMEILDANGRTAETLDGLARNRYGALAASVPAERLPRGRYRARLYSTLDAKAVLVGEYSFEVRR